MTAIPASPPTPRSWTGPLMVLAGGVGIGFAPIGLRFGLDDLGPQAIAFWRYVFALPLLLALVFLIERRAPRLPNRFILMAGTFFALDIALWHHALTLTTVSNATFIVNLGNVLVGFGAWSFLKQRPHGFWFVAAALAILGAAALSLGGGAEGKGNIRGDPVRRRRRLPRQRLYALLQHCPAHDWRHRSDFLADAGRDHRLRMYRHGGG
jgi:drug/metabolite transporter (DMT)-like permease